MKHKFEINNILFPIDFSESSKVALNHAVAICKTNGSSIHLLHILKPSIHVLPSISNLVDIDKMKSILSEQLNDISYDLKENHGIETTLEIREGSVSKEIASVANNGNHDMILMGTHGVSGMEEYFMGSNAFRVVTASHIPVLTIQESSKHQEINLIAVPIDSSSHSRDKISEVVTLAKSFDATVYLAGLITESHEDEEAIFKLKIKQIEEHLDIHGVKHNSQLIHGEDIAEMTNNFSQVIGADLIAIMTEQEASTGLFVGNYAQRIINHSRIPVLSVTPIGVVKGFSQSDLGGSFRPFFT